MLAVRVHPLIHYLIETHLVKVGFENILENEVFSPKRKLHFHFIASFSMIFPKVLKFSILVFQMFLNFDLNIEIDVSI